MPAKLLNWSAETSGSPRTTSLYHSTWLKLGAPCLLFGVPTLNYLRIRRLSGFLRRQWRAFSMIDMMPLKAARPYSRINWLRLCILLNSDIWQPSLGSESTDSNPGRLDLLRGSESDGTFRWHSLIGKTYKRCWPRTPQLCHCRRETAPRYGLMRDGCSECLPL